MRPAGEIRLQPVLRHHHRIGGPAGGAAGSRDAPRAGPGAARRGSRRIQPARVVLVHVEHHPGAAAPGGEQRRRPGIRLAGMQHRGAAGRRAPGQRRAGRAAGRASPAPAGRSRCATPSTRPAHPRGPGARCAHPPAGRGQRRALLARPPGYRPADAPPRASAPAVAGIGAARSSAAQAQGLRQMRRHAGARPGRPSSGIGRARGQSPASTAATAAGSAPAPTSRLRAGLQRQRPFGARPQGQAGQVERRRFLLHPAAVGRHQPGAGQQAEEIEDRPAAAAA